jgi:site-specific recombinase XerD
VNDRKVPVQIVQKMVGHAKLETTQAYLHTHEQEILDQVGAIYTYQDKPEDTKLRKAV